MWKQKIGISVYNHYHIPTCDVIRLLRETGFDAVSPEWEPEIDLNAIVETARQCGMTVQSLHAPYTKMQDIWNSQYPSQDRNSLRIGCLRCL